MSSPSRRRDMDVMKLMMSDFEVTLNDDSSMQEFVVKFHGPPETPYEGGVWQVRVGLPDNYPFRSPSIGFLNRIFHPNVDEVSGSVCLDVINQTWSPLFSLVNIFDTFLPQLLMYGNPTDPLNQQAAALMMQDPVAYEQVVRDYVAKYAQEAPHAQPQDDEGAGVWGMAGNDDQQDDDYSSSYDGEYDDDEASFSSEDETMLQEMDI